MIAPSRGAGPRPTASEDEIRLERLRQRRQRYPFWRLLVANLRDLALLLRQSWFPLASLMAILLSGALYLWLIHFPRLCALGGERCGADGDFLAALYVTVRLLVFEPDVAFPEDPLVRGLLFLVPLFGLFFLLQSVIDFARLLFNKDARREGWQASLASTFSDHVIVCGLGRVGYRVVLQLLDAGYEVVAIEHDWGSEFVPTLLRLKVPVVVGDARDPDVQRLAGLGRARSLIAAINDDLKNVEIALTARRRRPEVATVMRIFNRALDINLERSFGRHSAFSSSALAAPTFAAAAVSRAIVHVLPLPEGLLGLSELTVAGDSAIAGFVQAVEEQYEVRLLRLRSAAGRERRQAFMTRLEADDVALFLGPLAALERLRLANLPGSKLDFLGAAPPQRPTERLDTIIICGLGKSGSQVVRLLARGHPRPEIVVICTPETPQRAVDELLARRVRVLRGDARDPALLEEAGIARAYSVAALFGDDLLNLQIGLAARGLRPDVHLVLRVFSDVLAERLATIFGINTAYSTSALAAPTLAAAAVLREVEHAFDVGERLFASTTVCLREGDGLAGRAVRDLREREGALVVALRRAGQGRVLPAGETGLEPGDEVVLLADLPILSGITRKETRT